MSPSGIQLNKTAVVVILVLCGGLALLYRFYWHTPAVEKKMADNMQSGNTQPGNTQPGTWFTQMMAVPENVKEAAKKTTVDKKIVDFTFEGMEMKIRTREPALPGKSRGDVLLLHGQKFTSETWVTKCPTLQFLGAAGYRAVAVDLPNYGESTKSEIGADKRGSFIAALVGALKLTTPVIVSPSMSGGFSLPFLFDKPDTVLTRARGYVPVAPVETEKYTSKFTEAKIPTAIVTGDKDTSIGPKARSNLAALPNAKDFLLKDASHPAYLDDPDTWHAILFTFLNTVYKKMTTESAPSGWFTVMLTVPDQIKAAAKEVHIEKKIIDVDFESPEMKVCTREPVLLAPPRGDVLLLHGNSFTSETWATDCPTLQFMGAAGYRTVAVDLPDPHCHRNRRGGC